MIVNNIKDNKKMPSSHPPLKKLENFTLKAEIKHDERQPNFLHTVHVYEKNRKKSRWFGKQIGHKNLSDIHNKKLAILETVAQEFLRLLFPYQPKTRWIQTISKQGPKNHYVISKEMPKFDPFFFEKQDYDHDIFLGKVKNFGGILIAALVMDEIDLKPGNIGIDQGRVVKVDGGLSLAIINPDCEANDERSAAITEADIAALPNLKNFHADQWLDFICAGYTQAMLEKILPILDNAYFNSDHFKKFLRNKRSYQKIQFQIDHILRKLEFPRIDLVNYFLRGHTAKQVLTRIETIGNKKSIGTTDKLLPILTDYFNSEQFISLIKTLKLEEFIELGALPTIRSIENKLQLPGFNLLKFFLKGWTKAEVSGRLASMKYHSRITTYPSFQQERNRAMLRISLLPETLIYAFVRSYVPDDDNDLALEIAQTILQRQQQLIQEADKIASFVAYKKTSQAQNDLVDYIKKDLATFKTMGKSLLLTKEMQVAIFEKFIPSYEPTRLFLTELEAYLAPKGNHGKLSNFFQPKEQEKHRLAEYLKKPIVDYLASPNSIQLANSYDALCYVKKELLTELHCSDRNRFVLALEKIINLLHPSIDFTLLSHNADSESAIRKERSIPFDFSKQKFFKAPKKMLLANLPALAGHVPNRALFL